MACNELEHIVKTKPWTAIIPIYGDLSLRRLNTYLKENKQEVTYLKDLKYLSKETILESIHETNSRRRKELWLIRNLLPHIAAHRKAALIYSCLTVGSLFSFMSIFYIEEMYCTGNINTCTYSIDKTIPLTLLCASLPFFSYKFFLEPDIVEHEKEFEELLSKLLKN